MLDERRQELMLKLIKLKNLKSVYIKLGFRDEVNRISREINEIHFFILSGS